MMAKGENNKMKKENLFPYLKKLSTILHKDMNGKFMPIQNNLNFGETYFNTESRKLEV